MRAEYDFSKGKRRAIIPTKGKTRITIYINDAVLAEFRARAEKAGTGYQTMMYDALKAYLADRTEEPITDPGGHDRPGCIPSGYRSQIGDWSWRTQTEAEKYES